MIYLIPFTILIIGIIIPLYFDHRSDKVFEFLINLADECNEWNQRHAHDKYYMTSFTWAYNTLPSYNKMVFSFKPIKKQSFLSQYIINKLYE